MCRSQLNKQIVVNLLQLHLSALNFASIANALTGLGRCTTVNRLLQVRNAVEDYPIFMS
jgi:hypothetical protein